jgi:hypothetical protein
MELVSLGSLAVFLGPPVAIYVARTGWKVYVHNKHKDVVEKLTACREAMGLSWDQLQESSVTFAWLLNKKAPPEDLQPAYLAFLAAFGARDRAIDKAVIPALEGYFTPAQVAEYILPGVSHHLAHRDRLFTYVTAIARKAGMVQPAPLHPLDQAQRLLDRYRGI